MAETNYSIPKGADPMGIGYVDTGRSSYDPVETVRHAWDTYRRQQFIRDERRREDYRMKVSSLPDYKDINTRFAKEWNADIARMSSLYEKQYKAGSWSFLAKVDDPDKEGERMKLHQAVSDIENKVMEEGPLVNMLSETYKRAKTILDDPTKHKDLDMELSLANMKKYEKASIEEMIKLAPGLLVMKPTDVDINKLVKDHLPTYYKPTEKTETKINPITGNFEYHTTTKHDTHEAAEGMRQLFKNSELVTQRGIEDRYDRAPEDEKETEDGIEIGVEDWFATQHVPPYKDVLKIRSAGKAPTKDKDDKKVDWDSYQPKRDPISGDFILDDFVQRRTFYTKPEGEGLGSKESHDYTSIATFPLQNIITKPATLSNTQGTMNTETGDRAQQGRSALNVSDNIVIYPVATEDIEVKDKDGNVKKIKAGEKINDEYLEDLAKKGMLNKIMAEAFYVSAINNRMVTKPYPKDMDRGSYTTTTIRPLSEVRKELANAARKEGNSIEKLYKYIDEIVAKYNQSEMDLLKDIAKTKKDDIEYETYFK